MKKWAEICEMLKDRTGLLGPDGGHFILRRNKSEFYVIASFGGGWDHVSVSLPKEQRCPTWDEMCYVKDIFFEAEECVVQFHPPSGVYVNNHQFVLHLWRPQGAAMPMPDIEMV